MKTKLFIPARMGSSRFPGKPLYQIKGKPMLRWVYDASLKSTADDVFVTTPDQEIIDYCLKHEIPFVRTSNTHERCLDRVGEAAALVNCENDDIVICMQGDEPLVHESLIDELINYHKNNLYEFVVACLPVNKREFNDPNIVKVAYDDNFKTIYTSRAPIPSGKNGYADSVRIFGLFSFSFKSLLRFNNLPIARLEVIESCDTNRVLGSSMNQHICILSSDFNQQSVDCPDDIRLVLEVLQQRFT